MTEQFTTISLQQQNIYLTFLKTCHNTGSDYTFANIFGWHKNYGLEWRLDNSICWIKQTIPQKAYWAPVGDWDAYNWAECSVFDEGKSFIRVPEKLIEIWQKALPGRVEVTESRGSWDYLYNVEDLATLAGNRFHKKKNLLNQFNKNYSFKYSKLKVECIQNVLTMQAEWSKWREIEESPSLLAENDAIIKVLSNWENIPGLRGASLSVDDKIVAYTVAEAVCPETVVIHFEKGMPNYKGVYQAINYYFANEIMEEGIAKYLNREQDLDDEGLRKAKESYNPINYIKKNSVKILPK